MTPIQAQSLPTVLAGKDLIAQGKTGSGKTVAFSLGILNKLQAKLFQVQSLVLCPTRELADQVSKEIRKLARAIPNIKVLTLCGGMPIGPQIGSLEHGAHIIVGTPGRIDEHLTRKTLKLPHLNSLVLDEADRMLDMGFQTELDAIIACIPTERQTLLFSATFPEKIQTISKNIMQSPLMVKVESSHDSSSIKQFFYKVESEEQRMLALQLILSEFTPNSAAIFCNTKRETQELANSLLQQGVDAIALHGDLEQRDRDLALLRFANKSISILVATDVASRGLDIDSLDLVINYHMPFEAMSYIHRIGRTGRAGNKGIACTLFNDKEHYQLAQLEDYFDKTIKTKPLPNATVLQQRLKRAPMLTIQIDGGKKQKVRPGDILGALTGESGIEGAQVGKINVFANSAYIAIDRKVAKQAIKKLESGKIKGRSFRMRVIRG